MEYVVTKQLKEAILLFKAWMIISLKIKQA